MVEDLDAARKQVQESIDNIVSASKMMDEAPVPDRGRMVYDPETGEMFE
jgi:hypothetical protein